MKLRSHNLLVLQIMDWCPGLDPTKWDGCQSENPSISRLRAAIWSDNIAIPFSKIVIDSVDWVEKFWKQQLELAFGESGLPPCLFLVCCNVAIAFAKADSKYQPLEDRSEVTDC